jgi:vacuolar protein sorting-associated protein 13A/C
MNAVFQVSVNIALTYSGLTKIVTFTPFYLLNNGSKIGIEVKENGEDTWLPVSAGTVCRIVS